MKNMTNGDKLGIGIKVENYKKGKQQQVFEILDKEGYISDTQTFKIFGEALWKASEHIRIWKKLRADQNFFADKEIVEKQKGYRSHLLRIKGQESGQFYKVGKEFFNSVSLHQD